MMGSTLAHLIGELAAQRPAAPCLTFEGRTHSFAELDARSTNVACALAAAGVRPGDRVAILARNHPAFFELLFACNKLGGVMVPLNWRLSGREIEAIVRDGEPRAIVLSEEFRSRLPGDVPLDVIDLDDWEGICTTPGEVLPVARSVEDTALLLYTSGTTGQPKGVQLTDENLSYTSLIGGRQWGFTADSVNLAAMPLFHVGGIGYGLNALYQGGHTVILADAAAERIRGAIGAHGITHAFFVPAVIQAICEAPGGEDVDLSSLELVVYGASPISEPVLLRAIEVMGCRFTHAYGLTETAGTVVSLPPEDHDPGGDRAHLLRSCGLPFPWLEVMLVDPASEQPVAVGEVGEIRVRSRQVTPGYWRQPEATAAAFTDDGWFRTGDAASADADGYLYLRDRYKDMIVSGGENVYPAEVENVLHQHDAVGQVAVISRPHARWGETVAAVVVPAEGVDLDAAMVEDVIAFCRDRLAHYKCPTSVDTVDALPRSASGKVLKRELRDRYRAEA